ncbi:ATP-dependent protease ClpP protease subunit [Clostridium acetobutylicum]|uniref:head maturation protease, ClpP-related n=2 Tax=Clostridium TaxID=1485 RepID=UPI0009D25AD6|nr:MULTISPECIES: head maturation protease, ClpP-related [Clostridium]NOW12634.1 ATP-dependent protease ClpP protease subunit [Clostridium acetobutylicum]NSA93181.1 ATP-dependent protease ClpP protease subunit [Clostridium acetobutylicum]OOL99781.1 ATP-dependent Clp protease proteolytic subunit [Clostridium acetobutylicum]OOM05291.1 ATP-dependent Clp protease proteolytic subunit [Clostridium acetobutylicum]
MVATQPKQQNQQNKFWQMKASANDDKQADVFIYGEITSYQWDDTDTTAASFKKDLDALGNLNTINLHLNSPGGSVFEGVTICNMLKQNSATVNVYVDALAASIASVIAMAGDTIFMPKNAMLMVHNPSSVVWGNSSDMRKTADDLDKIGLSMQQSYLAKAGDKLDQSTLQQLMDNETWLSADECFSYGLCDVVQEENNATACTSKELFNNYRNVPKNLLNETNPMAILQDVDMEERKKIAEKARKSAEYTRTILGGI